MACDIVCEYWLGLCSSYRAELVALSLALADLRAHPDHVDDPVVICTDSQAALKRLQGGPSVQTSPLGVSIWNSLLELVATGRRLHLQ